MKWALIGIAAGLALMVFSQYALGALFVVAGVGVAAILGMKKAQELRPDTLEDDINPNDRYLVAPIRKQLLKIEEIVLANAENAGIKVIGSEALIEARSIYKQCVGLIREKADERSILDQKFQTEKDLADAETRLTQATSDEEMKLYQTAIETNKKVLSQAEERLKRFESIGANLLQAESALKLMVSQLQSLAQGGSGDGEVDYQLRESLSRLQTLGKSIGETDEFLENKG